MNAKLIVNDIVVDLGHQALEEIVFFLAVVINLSTNLETALALASVVFIEPCSNKLRLKFLYKADLCLVLRLSLRPFLLCFIFLIL